MNEHRSRRDPLTTDQMRQRIEAHAPALQPDPASVPPNDVSVWNMANGLTVLRILLVPLFGWLLLHDGGHQTWWRVAAFIVFAVASATDQVDGHLARSRNLVTDFGKMADPIADKALMGTALVGLSIIGALPWWLTIVILIREVGITVLRLVVLKHGVLPASRGGKLKTLLQGLAIGLFVLPLNGFLHYAAWVIMIAALIVTVVTGIDYVFRALALRSADRPSSTSGGSSADHGKAAA
ncbi:CDP-diacylglycerol--glycerol-3-phosphate 3-phosphatidyltransferase [Branchiibius hedensis]|uniref:CDP-diacylglycerol--glycerol-3-phosphate 3-phosphatidyltransferase n=1 Tax=Branchiibius hedensis TaxID=672460 RepID=A0A2Y8ZTA6_9MICO|nr:CDP-diacylglycerol--glycerol-3-phosphate 3-phosphatidyltransferase [Branchiibius hedensis]SSA33469.1 CDP-diacylglycerol--glycerol-3-phosphate 3-phosphatidyltransferase [Branchiibius hedensis]